MEAKGNEGRNDKALGVMLVTLIFLAFSSSAAPALATPFHARAASLDVTGLNHACGVATDSKGDLYLSSAGDSKVKVYDPSHVLLNEISDANTPCGLAVTTTGVLYVSEQATGEVVRFKPNAYPFSGTPSYGAREVIDASGKAKGIAVDPFDNRLYVAEGSKVAVYDATGAFEANLGEGTLTEATGVAAYTHAYRDASDTERTYHYLWAADANGLLPDRLELFSGREISALKPRRELTGATTPAGSFGFGAKGAYIAADPGNRDTEGKCLLVGEQACTAGHIYLYDAAHKALDELDATGEYLDQTRNAAFADAEPSAVAIERSATADDGTLYLTAGAGSSARALAFAPLKPPSRKVLKKPSEEIGGLSQELSNALAVATDSQGYLYAAQASLIHVFKPNGTEVKNEAGKTLLEDKYEAKGAKPFDLAVDSTGKIYVLDERGGFQGEELVAYYTPSAYPPTSSTTYTRHEVANPTKFPDKDNLIQAIAINPGPSPAKDRLFLTTRPETQEYDSAANGSGLLNDKFAAGLNLGNRQSIDVNGANGNVWFGANPKLVSEIDPSGKELLSQFDNAANGKVGFNPAVAVDQSNGHVIVFDGETSSAREFDAAGSFVAQFGSFTEGLAKPYKVAVDNSCAIQGLTGSACEAFDPANGTAYIAWADTSPTHPPYNGINAFGPLKYPEPGKHKLTVERKGSGSGTITSSPAGISCGATCTAEFLETEVVTLMATPAAGSEFTGWTGCEAVSGTECEVTMSEDRKVVAEFSEATKPKFKLTVKKTGTGSGTVTSSPAGIECGSTCTAEFEEGKEVTLSASPATGSIFAGWSGSGCSGTGTCKVTMSTAKEVTATFTLEQHLLTVTKEGSGSGKVTSSPAGIDCGSTCSALFDHGTEVTLSQEAASGSEFVGWGGACSGTGACKVTISEAKEVKATFNLKATPKFKLTVKEEGTGSGTVTSSPAGIECPPTCSAEFEEGKEVTLSASPAGGSEFAGWSGSGCSGTGSCKVTMTAAKEVTATFTLEEGGLKNPTLLKVLRIGEGTVVSSPAGIECGSTCEATFELNETVTLKASPAAGWVFSSWGGCTEKAGLTCKVTLSEAKTVKATFVETPSLTVEKAGSGFGKAIATGISCDASCPKATSAVKTGTLVTVKAAAAKGSEFATFEAGTGSAGSCSGATCSFTITEASSVVVNFSPIPTTTLTVNLTGPGAYKGKVTGKGTTVKGVYSTAINCGSGCTTQTETFFATGTTELIATAATGYTFAGWSVSGGSAGTCTGTTSPCTLLTDANKTVKAKFE
jgi:hypothetical protein